MCSNNIKVHLAGSSADTFEINASIWAAGGRRYLLTAYNYIYNKRVEDIKQVEIPQFIFPWKHIIIDSGLFTLMFGAQKNKPKTPEMIEDWMHRLVKFMQVQKFNKDKVAVVEVDAQKIISSQFTWELRKEMRRLLPGQEIINVFHLEDGRDGFEKLCEFSDYIAISVPELRIAQPKSYKNTTCALARMARQIKPGIKIHLLGCTEKGLLTHNRFCTSSDSSSWSQGRRFGYLDGHHVKTLKEDAVIEANNAINRTLKQMNLPTRELKDKTKHYLAVSYYNVLKCMEDYNKWGGNQD